MRDALHTAGSCLRISDLSLLKREGTSLIPEKEMKDGVFMCSPHLSSTAVMFAVVHVIDLILSINFPNVDYLNLKIKNYSILGGYLLYRKTITICFHHSSAVESCRKNKKGQSIFIFQKKSDSLVTDSLNMQNTQDKRQSHFPAVELFVNVMH